MFTLGTRLSLFNRTNQLQHVPRQQQVVADEQIPGPVAVQQQPLPPVNNSIPAGQVLLNQPPTNNEEEPNPMNLQELFPCRYVIIFLH